MVSGLTNFGQSIFVCCCCVLLLCVVVVCCVLLCVVCCVLCVVGCWVLVLGVGMVVGFGWNLRFPPCADSPCGPPCGPPKISLMVFPLPPPFSLFLSLSGCLLVEFWWCSRRPGPSNVSVRALTRQPENSERSHLRVLALQTPPKFHEKTP